MPHAYCVARYGTFTTPVVGLAATADGTVLAVAPQQGDLELWEVSTGRCLCRIPVPASSTRYARSHAGEVDEVYSLALSDDGLYLAASLRATGDIYLWTFEGDLLCTIAGDHHFTRTVHFFPHTSLLVVALQDTRIQLWDAATQQIHATLPGADEHSRRYLSGVGYSYRMVCSSDGAQIALDATTDGSLVSLWEVKQQEGRISCEAQSVLRWSKEEVFRKIKFRPAHAHLYHLVKKAIEGYDTHSCKLVTQIKPPGVRPVNFCFSPAGDLLAFADDEGMVYLWSLEQDQVLLQFDAREGGHPPYLYYDASVQQMAWLAHSNLLATVGLKKNDGSGVNTIKLWHLTL
jgi:WD40 repeat protein